jgi:hypothetical protein
MTDSSKAEGVKPGVPTSVFCLVCYFMAALALSLEVLPAEAFAIFGGRPAGETLPFSLAFAGIFLVIGGALHVVLYRQSPERFDVAAFRSAGFAMAAVLACLFGLSAALSRGTGLAPEVLTERFGAAMTWLGIVVVAGIPILLALFIGWLYVSLRLFPGNRIARRLAAGDLAGAIRIGESYPADKRDFTTNLNLTVAYAQAGEPEKAKRLLADLKQITTVPEHYTQESFEQALNGLRDVIAQPYQEATST